MHILPKVRIWAGGYFLLLTGQHKDILLRVCILAADPFQEIRRLLGYLMIHDGTLDMGIQGKSQASRKDHQQKDYKDNFPFTSEHGGHLCTSHIGGSQQ